MEVGRDMGGFAKTSSLLKKRKSGQKKYISKLQQKKDRLGYLFVLPFIVGLLVIFLPALYDSIVYSFSEVSIRLGSVEQHGVEDELRMLVTLVDAL